MGERIPVYVYAVDPLSQAGVSGQLRGRPEVEIVHESDVGRARVSVIVVEAIDERTLTLLRSVQRNGAARTVLVGTHLDDAALLTAAEAGVLAMIRRSDAVPERLVEAIHAADVGEGNVPPDILGRFLTQVGKLQQQVLGPRGMTFSGLTDREVDVLKLLADGHDTAHVAAELAYSERTIKNVIHDVTLRLNLRNRTHAVAYAVRQGLI